MNILYTVQKYSSRTLLEEVASPSDDRMTLSFCLQFFGNSHGVYNWGSITVVMSNIVLIFTSKTTSYNGTKKLHGHTQLLS
jgi:hypothetical protein